MRLGWLWLKGCQSPTGVSLCHPCTPRGPFLCWCPRPKSGVGVGWGRKEEEGSREGRAQAARAGRQRGRSRRVGAGWLRRQDPSRRGPGMDSFPPLFLPRPLIFSPQVPTSHHTPRSYTHHLLPPPAPHFLLSLLSWAQKDVGVFELRVGEGPGGGRGGGRGGRVRTFRSTPPGQDQPLPQPLVDCHIIFMSLMNTQCSHYGAGVSLGSVSPFTTPWITGRRSGSLGKRERGGPRCGAR